MTPLIYPLIASLLYVTAAMFIKRAADLGVGIWANSFVANIATAVFMACLWTLGGSIPSTGALYQPALVALVFIVGQTCLFLSLDKGDVSIATPVMGTKILVVAGFQTLLTSDPVTPDLWAAAALATFAVLLLNSSGKGQHSAVGFTIVTAFISGSCFALFDVLVQKWAPAWGPGRFLPILFGFAAVASLAFIPLFRTPIRELKKGARKPMLLAGTFMAAQAVTVVYAIAVFGRATEMNVVYASRGLWSVVAVWLIGHWFHNKEQEIGKELLTRRLVGATLLLAAIVLVLL